MFTYIVRNNKHRFLFSVKPFLYKKLDSWIKTNVSLAILKTLYHMSVENFNNYKYI